MGAVLIMPTFMPFSLATLAMDFGWSPSSKYDISPTLNFCPHAIAEPAAPESVIRRFLQTVLHIESSGSLLIVDCVNPLLPSFSARYASYKSTSVCPIPSPMNKKTYFCALANVMVASNIMTIIKHFFIVHLFVCKYEKNNWH